MKRWIFFLSLGVAFNTFAAELNCEYQFMQIPMATLKIGIRESGKIDLQGQMNFWYQDRKFEVEPLALGDSELHRAFLHIEDGSKFLFKVFAPSEESPEVYSSELENLAMDGKPGSVFLGNCQIKSIL